MGETSLKEIDPVQDLLARLRLDHAVRKQGAVVIEGPSDELILSAALGLDRRRLFQVGGGSNVRRCAEELQAAWMDGVICVGDRDFTTDEAVWSEFWWLVFYDDADIEAMLLDAEPLVRFLEEWGSKGKLATVGGVEQVRRLLRENAKPISSLRATNAAEGLGLPFDSIDLMDLVNKKDGSIERTSLVGKLAALSNCTHEELERAIERDPPTCPHTGQVLVRGRDLMAILSVMLRQLIGSLTKQRVRDRFVERSIRLATHEGDLDGAPFRDRFDVALARAAY